MTGCSTIFGRGFQRVSGVIARFVPEITPDGPPRQFSTLHNIRTRSLADQCAIEDVLAVEDDVVPFDRADVLEQGCVNAFLW